MDRLSNITNANKLTKRTSIKHPKDTYTFLDQEAPLEQLLRRIDNIIHLTNPKKVDTEVDQPPSSGKIITYDDSDLKSESETDTEVGGNTKTPTSPKITVVGKKKSRSKVRANLARLRAGLAPCSKQDLPTKPETVILDDFRGGQMQFNELLRLLDRYQHRVEIKGGSRQFDSPNIIITSIKHPKDTYTFLDQEEPLEQLLRRIDNIIHLTNPKKVDTEVDQPTCAKKEITYDSDDLKSVSETDTEVGGNTRSPISKKKTDNSKK